MSNTRVRARTHTHTRTHTHILLVNEQIGIKMFILKKKVFKYYLVEQDKSKIMHVFI